MHNVEKENFDSEDCSVTIKFDEAHKRAIVKMFFFGSYVDYSLVTVAHDSVKIWNVIDNENGAHFELISETSEWRCGVQSADMRWLSSEILVTGLDSVVYRVITVDPQCSTRNMKVLSFDLGYMEAWNSILHPIEEKFLTTSYSGFISEVDATNGKIMRKEAFQNVKSISCITASTNEKIFAIANNDGIVTLFDYDTFKVKFPMEVHAMKIRAMVFTGDEEDEYLLTASDDKTLRLTQIETDKNGTLVRQYCGHNSPILSLSIDPTSGGGRFASCSMSGELFMWDINNPSPTHSIKTPHDGIINSIVFSLNGHHLFSGGDDRRLVCYKVPQGGEPIELQERENGISNSPNENEDFNGCDENAEYDEVMDEKNENGNDFHESNEALDEREDNEDEVDDV